MGAEALSAGGPSGATRIDYAAELNEQQLAAVTSPGGGALVIAGAGSGKTRTLTYRVAWLLENGLHPWNILLLTFTNKAAREMLARVTELLGPDADGIWGGTFHSIGNRILRRHAGLIGFRPGFSILDREDQSDLLKSVAADAGAPVRDKRFPKPDVLAELFSLSANTGRPLPEIVHERFGYFEDILDPIAAVHAAYDRRKQAANVMDFDDLLLRTNQLLASHADVAEHYRDQFRHVLVDEYQDTNLVQSELVHLLGSKHGNIMVVGDDAQSIYSWRGANFENILNFPKRHTGAQTYRIETNYRSVPGILDVANAAIRGNVRQFEKNLRAWRKEGARPVLAELPTNNDQAAYVVSQILELNRQGIEFREMAVLYRAHFHSMEIQLELTRRGIPFEVTSGLRFFEQAHVKDVAAFLKFAVNPSDETAFRRMVRLLPGVGEKTADSLWSAVRAGSASPAPFGEVLLRAKPPSRAEKIWSQLAATLDEIAPDRKPIAPDRAIEAVMEAVYEDYMRAEFANYENRREDLRTLAGYARQFGSTEDFLAQVALLTNVDGTGSRADTETDRVVLSSVHQAKGLEWRAVFVVWLSEGMFPSSRSVEKPDALEEERRLFYVAVTRGRDHLHLCYPQIRLGGGYGEPFQRRSRFLAELPAHLLEKPGADEKPRAASPAKKTGSRDWWY
ncbi:MAG: ATP-dependent helicase [Chthoniobacterales bacterium]|nr:ATP-dependent helicase [Chthoniobacterales bacterium]